MSGPVTNPGIVDRLRRRWFDAGDGEPPPAGEGAVETTADFSSPQLGNRRALTVYLPPGYDRRRRGGYPLAFALDGQRMPDWRLAETAGALARAGEIPPLLVVAIPSNDERKQEYGTAFQADCRGRGARAAATQAFLVETVLPWVRSRYAAAHEPERTGIFGASLGGLMAFDTAWRHPQAFGWAACFSGALWWRTDDSTWQQEQATRIMHRRVREWSHRPRLRAWFQAGTCDETDDRDANGVIDAVQDTTELVDALVAKGYRRGEEVHYHEVAGGEHNEATWARALPEMLRWVFRGR